MKYDLFIFAGEPSGDLHGEALIEALLKQNPKLKIFGVGGPRMRNLPFESILPMEEFQVMGFVDVFLALPKIIRHFYALANLILRSKPKAALFIDYPGFNLRMERHLRKKGFKGKLVHYICPSIWAHGKGRIPLMEKNLDLLLSIFPFEKKYFAHSFRIHYVGHPLVSRILEDKGAPLPWTQGKKVIALFPGSRKKEILLNLPLQLKTLKTLLLQDQDTMGAISVSQEKFLPLLHECLAKEGLSINERLKLIPSHKTYNLMKSAHFALAKSGTVTLELALHKVPTVVTYGIAPLDLFIAKNILRISLPFYCIVNILSQKEIFKELIGPNLTEQALSLEAQNLLNSSYYQSKKNLLDEIFHILGKKKASLESARLLIKTCLKG